MVHWITLGGFYVAALLVDFSPDIQDVVGDVLAAAFIISITLWFAEVVVRLLVAAVPTRPGHASPVTGVVQNVVRIFVMLLGLVLLLGNFGISVAPMLTTLGIGGLAVALGLQETLANVFAGMQLTIARQMRIGDVLRLQDGEEMVLEDIGWRATRLRRVFTHTTVIVPNSRLAQEIITNYDLPTPEIGVLVELGVHFESDLAKVERIVCEVGKQVMLEVPGGVPTHVPFARFDAVGESRIGLVVHLRAVAFFESTLVRSEYLKRVTARFRDEGIVIPYPIRAIDLRQQGASTTGLGLQ